MNRSFIIILSLFAITQPATADVLGFYAGGGQVNYDLSGEFVDLEDGNTNVDFEDDLGLKGDSGSYIYVGIEHPIPLLPNLKIAHSEIDENGRNVLDEDIEFDDVLFPAGTAIDSKLDLTHTDFTFYYEILDNWVNLDLGLTARKFDGELSATGTLLGNSVTAEEDLDFIAPLLYGSAQFDLPFTGLYVSADGNWIGVGDANLYDIWARIGYTFAFGLGLEAGLRRTGLELDDVEGLDADVTLDGKYIALTFAF